MKRDQSAYERREGIVFAMSKILIFRPDNIGDVVLFTGALKHLRKKFPDAYITLAVLEHAVNLVEVCPYVDKCISLKEWPTCNFLLHL